MNSFWMLDSLSSVSKRKSFKGVCLQVMYAMAFSGLLLGAQFRKGDQYAEQCNGSNS